MPRAPIRPTTPSTTRSNADQTIPASNPMHCTQDRSDANVWAAAQAGEVRRRERRHGRRRGTVRLRFRRFGVWQALATISGGDVAVPGRCSESILAPKTCRDH